MLSFWQGANFRNSVLRLDRTDGSVPNLSRPDGAELHYSDLSNQLMLSVNGSDWAPVLTSAQLPSPPEGAAGDGITNDAPAIQAALDDAAAAGGGIVLLGVGNFRIDTGLTFPAGNIRLMGTGRGATTITYTPTTGTAIKSDNQAVQRLNISVEHLSLTGSGGTAVGIDLAGISESDLRGVEFTNFAVCLSLDGTVSCYWNRYEHCHFYAAAALSGQIGVRVGQSANAHVFDGCHFFRLARHVVIGEGVSAPGPNALAFFGCAHELVDDCAIDILRGLGVKIAGSRFELNALCLRLAGSTTARGITWDPDHLSTNTAIISGDLYGVTLQPGGFGANATLAPYYSQAPAPNRLQNALVEGWVSASSLMGWSGMTTSNWTTGAAPAREASVVASGTYSAKIGDGANQFRGIATTEAIAIRRDMPYTFSLVFTAPAITQGIRWGFRCYSDAAATVVMTTGTIQATPLGTNGIGDAGTETLSYSGGFNAHIQGSDTLTAVGNTYQRYAQSLLFPAGTLKVRVAIWTAGLATGLNAYVDELFLGEGPCPFSALARPVYDSGIQALHGDLRIGGSLGVGNSIAATTMGAVQRAVQVYDKDGVSLGFVAVHATAS